MKKSDFPARLWDYCAEIQANIRCYTDHDIPTLNGQVPKTVVTGNTADISELVEFIWYPWIYHLDATTSFPLPEEELGKHLGPSKDVGSKMSMWILKHPGQHCALPLILNLLVIHKRQRETSLPRISTKILVPPCTTLE